METINVLCSASTQADLRCILVEEFVLGASLQKWYYWKWEDGIYTMGRDASVRTLPVPQ